MSQTYIHGNSATERKRLALMNSLINGRCLEELRLQNERRVLDVGAGTGQFTRMMAARLRPEARVIAIERNPEQLEEALAGQESTTPGCPVEFRQGDATALPLVAGEAGAFDLAHARFLLEHVPDPLTVVREMVRAVRPGGRLVLADDDHELMQCWPEPAGFSAAWRAYFRSYRVIGTDPLIGRKLAELLHQAGVRPSRVTLVFYGACAGEAGFRGIVENLAGVLSGARETVLAAGGIGAAAYDRSIEAFRRWGELPQAAVWYAINWAEGRVPES